jgi:hypothetical protein
MESTRAGVVERNIPRIILNTRITSMIIVGLVDRLNKKLAASSGRRSRVRAKIYTFS